MLRARPASAQEIADFRVGYRAAGTQVSLVPNKEPARLSFIDEIPAVAIFAAVECSHHHEGKLPLLVPLDPAIHPAGKRLAAARSAAIGVRDGHVSTVAALLARTHKFEDFRQ